MRSAIRSGTAIALIASLAAASGCSVREHAARTLGDALTAGGEVYAADDDIEFVGAATPFGLKTIESLLAVVPDHRGLLLGAARGFTQYAYVYIQSPAEEAEERDVATSYAQRDRARRMYLRARDYGLRGLGVDRENLRDDPSAALKRTTREDVPLLYWTGVAWAAAIALGKDNPALVSGLPAVDALIERAAVLDADFDHGALRTFLIAYELSRPNAARDAAARSRAHFARAIELSGGRQAGPYVALAESAAIANRDRREFEALLAKALALDPGARAGWRLVNLVMQRRARRLLARADEFFPE
ncbi:MAG: hypothetical protein EPO27_07065 [Betaproteobacteria bacterium]|nr:MAG: hypothetical protein EPO27_07065 [Betaproteobacteria bacterium]